MWKFFKNNKLFLTKSSVFFFFSFFRWMENSSNLAGQIISMSTNLATMFDRPPDFLLFPMGIFRHAVTGEYEREGIGEPIFEIDFSLEARI